MTISKEIIQELREILREDYGKETTEKEAYEIARSFIDYFDLLNEMKNEYEKKQK